MTCGLTSLYKKGGIRWTETTGCRWLQENFQRTGWQQTDLIQKMNLRVQAPAVSKYLSCENKLHTDARTDFFFVFLQHQETCNTFKFVEPAEPSLEAFSLQGFQYALNSRNDWPNDCFREAYPAGTVKHELGPAEVLDSLDVCFLYLATVDDGFDQLKSNGWHADTIRGIIENSKRLCLTHRFAIETTTDNLLLVQLQERGKDRDKERGKKKKPHVKLVERTKDELLSVQAQPHELQAYAKGLDQKWSRPWSVMIDCLSHDLPPQLLPP